jgi:hypothetical protein
MKRFNWSGRFSDSPIDGTISKAGAKKLWDFLNRMAKHSDDIEVDFGGEYQEIVFLKEGLVLRVTDDGGIK